MSAESSSVTITPGPRMKTALAMAIVADILQMIVFPLVIEGFPSPADDLIDLCVGAILGTLLGWHWEFMPSFLGKLVPGLDIAPLWTLAVANVYRKSRRLVATSVPGAEKPATGANAPRP